MEALLGKTALVTGASKRIGREIVLALGEAGVNVIIHYNKSEKEALVLCEVLKKTGLRAWIIKADFNDVSQYENLVERALELAGNIDFLINSASIFPSEDSNNLNYSEFILNFKINSWGPFVLCLKFINCVGAGKIINILDTRINGLDWDHIGYTLSKQALSTLTKMIALKYAPEITVNAIAPGLILSPPGLPQSYLENKVNTVPLKRHGDPRDIAEAVIFLLRSSFITGNIIFVDGGAHLKEHTNG